MIKRIIDYNIPGLAEFRDQLLRMYLEDFNYLLISAILGLFLSIIGYYIGRKSGRKYGYSLGVEQGRQQGYSLGKERALEDIQFRVIPLIDVKDHDLLFWKSSVATYGYQFQMFVKGIPALKSEETIIGRQSVEEIDTRKVRELVRTAIMGAVTMYAGGPGGFSVALDKIDQVLDQTMKRIGQKTK